MQKNSSSFEQGCIVIADILYSLQAGIKRRPVLVISGTRYNASSDDIIVLSISSTPPKVRYDIKLANNDLTSGGLRAESKILVDFPTTIEKRLVAQNIGKISDGKLSEVKQKMKELYSL